jgi:predicted SAM-dependent methyltransferase
MNTLDKLVESGLHNVEESLKLHLGCGQTKLDGFINIDFPQDKHNVMISAADAEADITKDLLFPRFSVDEIRLHHLFEHFPRVVALAQLVKWHFWLKIDGILIIETPDFMGSIQQIVDNDIEYAQKMAIVRHLVGDQAAEWGFHIDQWWKDRFETTLSSFGFHVTDIKYFTWEMWPHLKSITVTATKVAEISIAEQIKKCFLLLKDSMVSEREVATFEVWQHQLLEELKEYTG